MTDWVQTLAGAVLGCLTTFVLSFALTSLEPPEIKNYQPGKPVFTMPVTETYARVIQKQLEDGPDAALSGPLGKSK